MHSRCLQFLAIFLLLLAIFAKDDRVIKRKLKYKPRTAHQLREYHKNHPQSVYLPHSSLFAYRQNVLFTES
jgi:hypothetical protein